MNQKLLSYKGYHGTVEYSLEDQILYGKVVDINGLISYEGTTIAELTADFKEAIDDYLQMCKDHNEAPEKSFTGSFNVRISPQLHRQLALYAASHHQSLNSSVKEAVEKLVKQK